MTNPQPDRLKPPPRRADPWQPDKPGADAADHTEDAAASDPGRGAAVPATSTARAPQGSASQELSNTGSARQPVQQKVKSAVSAESAIPRDPQTGQALDDPSLKSGDESQLSDGRAGSTRLPES